MKILKLLTPIVLFSVLISSCSGDDDTPIPVNEEEIITSVIATLVSDTETITLSSRDLDGDGPNAPVVTVSGNLKIGKTYAGTVQFLNETVTPAENITEEVEEEAEEHQLFFLPRNRLDVTIAYDNADGQGNPLGTRFILETPSLSSGTLNITLRHEPKKPNDGTLEDAGGETDASVSFDITVEE